ncbi:hypothetical protein GCM10023335_75510 [Streptomyces siamensis]|uniref:Helicase-associated domain-containing protein n=1 Tax=Streptomyces siamensis TaxID=1274986 RepID=A0ABP9JHZ2_9ACTN
MPARRSQDERWAVNLAAARQFHGREGHLIVPRKHVETITVDADGGQEAVKLGAFVDNSRRRASKLSNQRRAALDELSALVAGDTGAIARLAADAISCVLGPDESRVG